MSSELLDVVDARERGEVRGIWSVCSAHGTVLEAAAEQAVADGSVLLVESTANQVNQEGGYTGMTPAEFAAFAGRITAQRRLPPARLVLGADHVGPLPFRGEPSSSAMAKACDLVRACVHAGYTKLHLDASMRLADDAGRPTPELVTERAVALCAAAEEAHRQRGAAPPPLYVIGTDVPAPGGEVGEAAPPHVTPAVEVERTAALFKQALTLRGLDEVWGRVVAVVVQPGVGFTDLAVHGYDRARAAGLRAFLQRTPCLVYEAHSTDYQAPSALAALVEDGFAILKVGPALTFAFREALFALEAIEREWLRGRGVPLSDLRDTLDAAMDADPAHWRSHHQGEDESMLRTLRTFAYSDRVRYYWPQPGVQQALARLFRNLSEHPAPLPFLGQYLPAQAAAIRAGVIGPAPPEIVRHKIREVTAAYARACRPSRLPAGE